MQRPQRNVTTPAGSGCHLVLAIAGVLLGLSPCRAAEPAPSPYAGFAQRAIKALSAEETEGLREGRGLGFALAAELNGHPGPKHVLELAGELDLTDEQSRRTREAFEAMRTRAVALGERLIATEAALDEVFATQPADARRVAKLVREAARLRGDLRLAHLEAHLRMTEILTPEQVAAYARLRGYAGSVQATECPNHPAGSGR